MSTALKRQSVVDLEGPRLRSVADPNLSAAGKAALVGVPCWMPWGRSGGEYRWTAAEAGVCEDAPA